VLEIHAAIIGLGPRGLTVLESIGRLVRENAPSTRFVIHLIDPGANGQGSHPSRQPDHLLTNTLASQVTMFPLKEPDRPAAGNAGPSFTQWAQRAGYRRRGDRYFPVGETCGDDIGDSDYLPRSMLGEYLAWYCNEVLGRAPDNIGYRRYKQRAVDLCPTASEDWIIKLENGFAIRTDFVFLTTGHCQALPDEEDRLYDAFVQRNAVRNGKLDYFRSPYPVDRLSRIDPEAIVAIQGLGLTAHDVISELTVGRGGRFVAADDGLDYQPSGDEPKLRLFSRHCIPAAARGVNQKGIAGRHEARFFTREAVHALRERVAREAGSTQLDFVNAVLPLIKKEMCWAWRLAVNGRTDLRSEDFVPTPQEIAAVGDILDPLAGRRFDDFQSFRQFALAFLKADLAEAERGNQTSPAKAATDVIRDARDAICAATEYRGLDPHSHRYFVESFVPLMNRISFGPPRRRNVELLALIKAGILDWAGGPGARVVADAATGHFAIETAFAGTAARINADVLIKARLDTFSPLTDSSPLTRNLAGNGLIEPYRNGSYHPGGLDIDRNGRPIASGGFPLYGVWALGYPTEGVHFYTHALPRPFRSSGQILDAEKCVRQMLDEMATAFDPAALRTKERAA
jgi:uncharacterized NAD(P)/FAD-binding protein YdhS